MSYLISRLWKLPEISSLAARQDTEEVASSQESLLATSCRDCGCYNFPPKPHCRYCQSPRVRTVVLSAGQVAHPGGLLFESKATQKPN